MDTSILFALSASAAWAVGSLLFGHLGRNISAAALNFAKCATASLMLVATWALSGATSLDAPASSWWLLLASAVVGLTIGDTAYFAAIRHLGVGRAILLLSTAPLFATLGGVAVFGEHMGARELAGIALTSVGIVVVVGGKGVALGGGPGSVRRGVALGLFAAVMQATGTMLSRSAMRGGIDPLAAAAARVGFAACALAVVAIARGHLRAWVHDLRRDSLVFKIGGAAFVGTYGGIWLAQLALAGHRSTGVTTTLLATSPIFALPIERFILGVPHGLRAFIGATIAVAGIAVLST